MAKKRARRNTNKKKNKKQLHTMLLAHQRFSKAIRNELRMTCALHGYSVMRMDNGKTLAKQKEFINAFYHGNTTNTPSQIKMLAEGVSLYSDLYNSRITKVLSKKSQKSTKRTKLYLKESLSREPNRSFCVDDEIKYDDLEKNVHRS